MSISSPSAFSALRPHVLAPMASSRSSSLSLIMPSSLKLWGKLPSFAPNMNMARGLFAMVLPSAPRRS